MATTIPAREATPGTVVLNPRRGRLEVATVYSAETYTTLCYRDGTSTIHSELNPTIEVVDDDLMHLQTPGTQYR